MWESLEVLNDFNPLTLKQVFLEIKNFLKKLEYPFLVESTTIKNAVFPYKTALPKSYVEINRMGSTKWTYHKKQSLATNYFIKLKIYFQRKNCW